MYTTRPMIRDDIKNGIFVYQWFSYFDNITVGFFNGDYSYSINEFGQIVEIDNIKTPFPDKDLEHLCVMNKKDAIKMLKRAHLNFDKHYKNKSELKQAIFERYRFDFNRSIKIVEKTDTNKDCREILSKLYQDFKNFPPSRYGVMYEVIDWEKDFLNMPHRLVGLLLQDEARTEEDMEKYVAKKFINPKNMVFKVEAVPENDITKMLIGRNNHYVFNGQSLVYVARN